MSQWVPNPESLAQSQEGESDSKDSSSVTSGVSSSDNTGSQGPVQKPHAPARVPWWAQLSPFFLSAFFFLSALLVIFAPLPLLFLNIKRGRKWAYLAALTNGALVVLLGGGVSALFYLVWVVVMSFSLAEVLRRKKSLEASVIWTLVSMALFTGIVVGIYAYVQHFNPVVEIRSQISNFVDYLGQSVSVNSGMMGPGDMEEWKQGLLLEFPSAMAIFSLVMVWANLMLLLKVNPEGLREKLGLDPAFLRQWKAPAYLVWPTIVFGFFLVVDAGVVSDVSLNVFKFLMAIYAIQGLSVLSYFFELWGVRGFFRLVGFCLSLFLMMPLVLSLGFFDLWFDFRAKFRQS